tara:strand:+ start:13418 stop:13816 length:399 start_codon:yes stop_codon:yes gene_type:complete
MGRYSYTRSSSTSVAFFDASTTGTVNIEESMTAEQKIYLALQKAFSSTSKTVVADDNANTITFQDITIATPPAGFPALTKDNFQVFINGVIVEIDAITSIVQSGSNVVVSLNTGLNYDLSSSDEYMITGKFD